MGFLPPLGLEFIATALRPHAKRLDLVDLRKVPGRTKDFIRPETDLVCFSVNWEFEADFVRDEIRSVPEGIFTIVGGRHAMEDPEGWLNSCPNVNGLVRGDGEEVVEELAAGTDLARIQGLSFRDNGSIHHNPNRTLGPVRNGLYPDRARRAYKYNIAMEKTDMGIPIDLLSASRGCPFNCTFCSFSRNPWGEKRKWSVRSPESIVRELLEIEAPIVGFTDDLFTHDMNRVERICDLILAKRIRKHYLINARLEISKRPDVLRKMERAGFCVLMLGIESAHDKTLKSMRKGFTTKRIREHFEVLRNSSMILHGYFILGNIGETIEEMEDIIPFARELGVDTIAISTLRNSPFSGLEDLVKSSPGYGIADNGKIYSQEYSVEDLRLLRRKLYKQFYTPGHLLKLTRKVIGLGAMHIVPLALPRLPRIVHSALSENLRRAKRRRARKREKKQARIRTES
ncbi:MAG: B12-binding domain-containing radical SAM protein [Planctomycetota bacterium]